MKVLPFKIPKTERTSLVVQEDDQPFFFDTFHSHPELQITLITESSGTLIVGDSVTSFRKNDIFILGKNLPHVLKNDMDHKKGNNAQSVSLFVEEDLLLNVVNSFPELRMMDEFIHRTRFGLKVRDDEEGNVRKKILAFRKRKSDENIFYFFHLMYTLSQWSDTEVLSGTLLNNRPGEEDGRRLAKILDFTLKRFQHVISLDEVSEVANLSKTAFCRYFKQRTRKTYVDFLTEVRISKACELLLHSGLGINEIAMESGYKNLSNFNRKFKLIKKMTPAQYRKLMKNAAFKIE
ncbi:MAG: AraC family transcriptional regulator [Cyclobacteriaceae bacterium]|nr:AraC family transcriptional regulator [Cyclobacteriaceae bacterium]